MWKKTIPGTQTSFLILLKTVQFNSYLDNNLSFAYQLYKIIQLVQLIFQTQATFEIFITITTHSYNFFPPKVSYKRFHSNCEEKLLIHRAQFQNYSVRGRWSGGKCWRYLTWDVGRRPTVEANSRVSFLSVREQKERGGGRQRDLRRAATETPVCLL